MRMKKSAIVLAASVYCVIPSRVADFEPRPPNLVVKLKFASLPCPLISKNKLNVKILMEVSLKK